MSYYAAGIGTIVESSEHSATSTSPSTRSPFSPEAGQDHGAVGSRLLLLAADRSMRCVAGLCCWQLCATFPAESLEQDSLLLLGHGRHGMQQPLLLLPALVLAADTVTHPTQEACTLLP